MRFLIGLFLILVFGVGRSQQRLDSLYFKSDLQADLEALKKELMQSHPDPFAFTAESYFNKVFEASGYAIDERTTLRDYSLIVANLLNTLRDSHTSIDYSQLQYLQMADGGYFLPLQVERVSNGRQRFYVKGDWENKITRGSELLSINSVSVESMFKHAMSYACIEGDATEAQNSVATSIMTICAGLKNPYDKVNRVQVVDFQSGDTLQIELRGFQRKEFYRKRMEREQADMPFPVTLKMDDEHNLAVLRVSTFAPPASGKYRKRLKESFALINEGNYGNLAIDLRGNGGGSSALVEYLYAFLDTAGYNTPSNVIGKNSELAASRARLFYSAFGNVMAFLFFKNNEDVQSFRHFASLPRGGIDTVFFKNPTRHLKQEVFTGKCYLMINGLTASAAVDFTNGFQRNHRGQVVGQQCLGPKTGTWGNPALYTLPKTGLQVSIATIRYNYDDSFTYERKGIIPDHWVDCTPADLNLERDTQLEFILNLLKEK
ncbi:MAG: S41 family peptidase [Flavobacteriales bacterium]|jgi:hypothetical protein